MSAPSYTISKPLFLLLSAGLVSLGVLTGFFYQEKQTIQEQNRQLIIQNDSIISVNILLNDSIRQKPPEVLPKKNLVSKFGRVP
jgi:uncharacterized membrane protein YciS (DUF1049 family)